MKKERVEKLQATTLQDLLDTIVSAKAYYDNKHIGNKAKERLVAFSKRVCYYGKIMDAMVAHHPEYVSLVWGAMKLFFGVSGIHLAALLASVDKSKAFVEHESTASTVATALCDIADSLPHTELASTLYPTSIMKNNVALLYAHIVRFLIRALQWYEEGKLKHTLHSITRPAALHYADLIEDIKRDTRSITSQAIASSQAEQRDMHVELRELRDRTEYAISRSREEQHEVSKELNTITTMFIELRESIMLEQSVNARARIEFRDSLSKVQFTQALDIISSQCRIDHKSQL